MNNRNTKTGEVVLKTGYPIETNRLLGATKVPSQEDGAILHRVKAQQIPFLTFKMALMFLVYQKMREIQIPPKPIAKRDFRLSLKV